MRNTTIPTMFLAFKALPPEYQSSMSPISVSPQVDMQGRGQARPLAMAASAIFDASANALLTRGLTVSAAF